ncbi:MAG: hypothetical protein R3F49_18285 [Planctomycetota bacterium]
MNQSRVACKLGVGVLVSFLWVGCSNSNGSGAAAESTPGAGKASSQPAVTQRAQPLATLMMPATAEEGAAQGWVLPEAGVTPMSNGTRTGLLFKPGQEALAVTFPAPAEAAGAGRIVLRVMSDGPFTLHLALGANDTTPVASGDTRRRWREVAFPLGGPLSAEALKGPLRLVRDASELPVIIEAIRFLP